MGYWASCELVYGCEYPLADLLARLFDNKQTWPSFREMRDTDFQDVIHRASVLATEITVSNRYSLFVDEEEEEEEEEEEPQEVVDDKQSSEAGSDKKRKATQNDDSDEDDNSQAPSAKRQKSNAATAVVEPRISLYFAYPHGVNHNMPVGVDDASVIVCNYQHGNAEDDELPLPTRAFDVQLAAVTVKLGLPPVRPQLRMFPSYG
jgi:hypothetical protein